MEIPPIESTSEKHFFGKISTRLVFGFLIIALLIGVVGVVSLFQNKSIQRITEQEIYKSISDFSDAWIIMEAQGHQEIAVNNFLFLDEGIDKRRADYFYEKDRWEKTYQKLYSESCEHIKPLLEKYYKNMGIFNTKIEESFELYRQGADLEIIKEKVREANEYSEIAHEEALEPILEYIQTNHIEPAKQNIAIALERTKIFVLITTFIAFFLSIVLGFFISDKISKPVKELYNATREVEKGNFKTRVKIKTNDEIEQLGNAFNKTTSVLEGMDRERKQLEKAKTEFLSITSHELRSPMTPMKAQLQMLIKGYFGKLNEKQKESLNITLKNTDRLDRIIVDFLDISRIEAARLKFDFRKVDLTKTISDTVEYMKGFDPVKKINIVAKVGKLPIIEADPDRFSQVLRNLIGNAIKFSSANSRIIVESKLQGDMILCSVEDQGTGISSEDQLRIFEPFFQGDKSFSRKKEGTGLGLAISRGIVKSQNGEIWVKSQKNKGSIFYFTTPLNPVREIKPIKVLFSSQIEVDEKIKLLFSEILGPIGENEFKGLKNKNQISESQLVEYVNFLVKKGIILEALGILFKTKILEIFKIKATSKPVTKEIKK